MIRKSSILLLTTDASSRAMPTGSTFARIQGLRPYFGEYFNNRRFDHGNHIILATIGEQQTLAAVEIAMSASSHHGGWIDLRPNPRLEARTGVCVFARPLGPPRRSMAAGSICVQAQGLRPAQVFLFSPVFGDGRTVCLGGRRGSAC